MIEPHWDKEEARKWKYGNLPKPKKSIPWNGHSSNIGVISFETADDGDTKKVLQLIGEQLLDLKNKQYPGLTWNAGEAHYRDRWTRYQLVFDR